MITLLLHLLRLLPVLCGGHHQLALENLALHHQLAVGLAVQDVDRVAGSSRGRGSRDRPGGAASPRPRALAPTLRPADRRAPARPRRDQGPGGTPGPPEPPPGPPGQPW